MKEGSQPRIVVVCIERGLDRQADQQYIACLRGLIQHREEAIAIP